MSMAKRLILTLGSKGGTGKSTFARVLADRLRRECPERLLLVDGDDDVGHLMRFYGKRENGRLLDPQPLDGVLPFYMHGTDRDRDRFVNMLSHDRDIVLADLPGGSLRKLYQMEDETGLLDVAGSLGYVVTFVNVIEGIAASTSTVAEMIRLGGERAQYVVVLNMRFGDPDGGDFLVWYGSPEDSIEPSAGVAMLKANNGYEIRMPMLGGGTVGLIDMYKLTYTDATAAQELRISHRSRVHKWITAVDEQLTQCGSVLGLQTSVLRLGKKAVSK